MWDKGFKYLQARNVPILAAGTGLIAAAFVVLELKRAGTTPSLDPLLGEFVSLLFTAAAFMGSAIAFALILCGTKSSWGEAGDSVGFLGLGSIAGLVVSAILLLRSFHVI